MEVLKGASAASLWGTRAATGDLITPKRPGSKGKVNIFISNRPFLLDEMNRLHGQQGRVFGQGIDGR